MTSQVEGQKKKVYIGMSGGVDSSVSAYLLKKAGYDVTGVFIKVWEPPFLECTWRADRLDAMRIAAKLDIPFLTLDLEKEYKKNVVDYMVSEYESGRTPNPDVACNGSIKFGAFYKWARSKGADIVATGHYARVSKSGTELQAGIDANKDQSYFLWMIQHADLKNIVFPIGELQKNDVRKIAKKAGLSTADKKDSQGLCFLGKVDLRDFLLEFVDQKRGDVLNTKGDVIGFHDGSFFFTIGQRHGFHITSMSENMKPMYVIEKDLNTNSIVVSDNPTKDKAVREIIIDNENWVSLPPVERKKHKARVRYRQKLVSCELATKNGATHVIFEEPIQFPAVGQSLVLYDQDICLGGGIISSIL